uniref:Protein T04A11.11 putative n=1 Tax=Albugo laibachii Nc14 TaxID=890382 RepID=F0WTJ4_9STRA|nr:protein T04A11.11 putative [Albugo laibachii Nc14]|eukprot:CCA24685.1 protein T04A11.11 putative [Albugo laibachii Nc14]
MNKAPNMTIEHEKKRLVWIEKMVDFGSDNWRKVIISDGKKWILDGPDGLRYYWHALRNEKKTFFSRQNGGGSVMVWAGFWAEGTKEISFLDGIQKGEDYIWTLSEYMLPAAHRCFGTDYIFQQDNASIHRADVTRDFFDEH